MGKVNKLGAWIPHTLTDGQLATRVSICSSLMSRFRIEPFLDRIVTGDEKWVLRVNTVRKRQWVDSDSQAAPCPKANLHPKKVLLCVWWNMNGIVHFELLPPNYTVTAELYAQQLNRVNIALIAKQPSFGTRKKVALLHDNARPHVAYAVNSKISELGWEVLPHPPYSPDIAPSDYHLFRSLQNHIREKTFNDDDDIESSIRHFFNCKSPAFYKSGIEKLPERWQMIIDNDGAYVDD